MDQINIRAIKNSDLSEIYEMMQEREGFDRESARKRTKLLEWVAFNNPFANGQLTYYVAELAGKVVAHLGRMPLNLSVNGQCVNGYFQHDLFVHPLARKKGLAKILYNTLDKGSEAIVLTGLWANPINMYILRKRGYYELAALQYVKILDFRKLLDPRWNQKFIRDKRLIKLFSPLFNLIIKLIDAVFLNMPKGNVKIRELNRFDACVDRLSQKVSPKLGITVYRTSRYLNWKFVDRPFHRNKIFMAERNGVMTGYIVLGPVPKKTLYKVSILDILADPDDRVTVAALCRTAISYYQKKKVYAINCVLTEKKYAQVFRRYLFLQNPSPQPFMMTNLDKCQGMNVNFLEIDNWHISYGDSDGSMFNF